MGAHPSVDWMGSTWNFEPKLWKGSQFSLLYDGENIEIDAGNMRHNELQSLASSFPTRSNHLWGFEDSLLEASGIAQGFVVSNTV